MWPSFYVWNIVASLPLCFCIKYLRFVLLFWLCYADENRLHVYQVLSPGFLNFLLLIFFLKSRCGKFECSSDYHKKADLISHCYGYIWLFSEVQNTDGSRVVKKINKFSTPQNLLQWLNTDNLRNYNPLFWTSMTKSFCKLFHWDWLPRGFINLYAWLYELVVLLACKYEVQIG